MHDAFMLERSENHELIPVCKITAFFSHDQEFHAFSHDVPTNYTYRFAAPISCFL